MITAKTNLTKPSGAAIKQWNCSYEINKLKIHFPHEYVGFWDWKRKVQREQIVERMRFHILTSGLNDNPWITPAQEWQPVCPSSALIQLLGATQSQSNNITQYLEADHETLYWAMPMQQISLEISSLPNTNRLGDMKIPQETHRVSGRFLGRHLTTKKWDYSGKYLHQDFIN